MSISGKDWRRAVCGFQHLANAIAGSGGGL